MKACTTLYHAVTGARHMNILRWGRVLGSIKYATLPGQVFQEATRKTVFNKYIEMPGSARIENRSRNPLLCRYATELEGACEGFRKRIWSRLVNSSTFSCVNWEFYSAWASLKILNNMTRKPMWIPMCNRPCNSNAEPNQWVLQKHIHTYIYIYVCVCNIVYITTRF